MAPSAGFNGLIDFTGLQVGESFVPAPPVPGCGFLGFDFTGLGTGMGSIQAPSQQGHGGFRGAGRRYANLILQRLIVEEQIRIYESSRLKNEMAVFTRRIEMNVLRRDQEIRYNRHQRRIADRAMTSVLLAEI